MGRLLHVKLVMSGGVRCILCFAPGVVPPSRLVILSVLFLLRIFPRVRFHYLYTVEYSSLPLASLKFRWTPS